MLMRIADEALLRYSRVIAGMQQYQGPSQSSPGALRTGGSLQQGALRIKVHLSVGHFQDATRAPEKVVVR